MVLQRKNESREASSTSLTRYAVAGCAPRRILLDPEQKIRRDQQRLDRLLDAAVEIAARRAPVR